ncbi:hypothetical protein D6829_02275 [Candidatus Pacearchaeota archaeon]|nr:MAG: hypothetical protein D6829_02275 [Candidatus Pacearchaeota archaeon]
MMHQNEKEIKRKLRQNSIIYVLIGIFVSGLVAILKKTSLLTSVIILFAVAFLLFLNGFIKEKLSTSRRIHKIEEIFPDFLQLVSSNLRAGMTVDKAIILSAREEFDPLDKEILKAGRDITVGKTMEEALTKMAERIGSEKIKKTVRLIISGIRSGGDLAVLLDETASNMRDRSFLEKRAASNVLMYVIFIFVAVAVGAPALFALSNILVEVLSKLLGNLPEISSVSVPFTLSKLNISTNFVLYFSIFFLITIDFLASLVLGLVSKGEEKEGLKFFPILVALGLLIFFVVKILLRGFVSNII